MKKIRLRFAPSPTGPLHLGGLRTALYNYMLAKKYGGNFILRIEDTDKKRLDPGAEDYILESLYWCGLIPDESPVLGGKYGPYRQSERKDFYLSYICKMIDNGTAYYAFDTLESLNRERDKIARKGNIFTYNARNRLKMDNSLSISYDELIFRLKNNTTYVIRFKTPCINKLTFNDEIHGTMNLNTKYVSDIILIKSDGMPTYHFSSVIDDHLMEITHVIRGEEWLSTTSLHIMLYKSLGWKLPNFAHIPLIFKPTGKGKLSKREKDGINLPLKWKDPKTGIISIGYREEGFLPEAIINILAFLGWNPGGNEEVFFIKELIEKFSLKRVQKSGVKFNKEKANWFNKQHIKIKSIDELVIFIRNELKKNKILSYDQYIIRVLEVIRDRIHFINDLWWKACYFFKSPKIYNTSDYVIISNNYELGILQKLKHRLMEEESFFYLNLKILIIDFTIYSHLDFNKIKQLLRLALVGSLSGADIFFIMEMIGKIETINRIFHFTQYHHYSR